MCFILPEIQYKLGMMSTYETLTLNENVKVYEGNLGEIETEIIDDIKIKLKKSGKLNSMLQKQRKKIIFTTQFSGDTVWIYFEQIIADHFKLIFSGTGNGRFKDVIVFEDCKVTFFKYIVYQYPIILYFSL